MSTLCLTSMTLNKFVSESFCSKYRIEFFFSFDRRYAYLLRFNLDCEGGVGELAGGVLRALLIV